MKTKHPIFSRWLVLLGPCFRVSSVLFAACVTPLSCFAADLGSAPVFAVKELSYTSATTYSPTAYPADPAGLTVVFQHSGGTTLSISGFWDGDGLGGSSGNVWKVRFTPTLSGTWTVLSETSSIAGLEGDHLGDTLTATAPTHPGFWLPDPDSANGRWFKRSDGSHPYILGNTHYDFLHAPNGNDATPATIVSDIEANATRYNKLRFGLSAPGSRNINSSVRPFFDASGNQVLVETDRPNPAFFRQRVDAAVQRGYELDFICDLILELGDNQLATNPTYLRYVAARYGAYPNVWFCLGNESLERNTTSTVNSIGNTLRAALPYPSPVSVHMVRGWEAGLSGTWYSHTINQYKLDQHFVVEKRNLAGQADRQISEFNKPNVLRPVINDECAYDPNEATELQAIESSTGCFLGGAYSSGGEKTASKQGGYFFGYSAVGSTIDAHPSSDNTGWLRQKIDQYIPFWTLSPSTPAIFGNLATQFRALAAPGSFYVLGSNSARTGITAVQTSVRSTSCLLR